VLTDLFKKRGVKLDRTYQLNNGGNTDVLERARLVAKKKRSSSWSVSSAGPKKQETQKCQPNRKLSRRPPEPRLR
jgi:myo-inositol-1-phosphate synthase